MSDITSTEARGRGGRNLRPRQDTSRSPEAFTHIKRAGHPDATIRCGGRKALRRGLVTPPPQNLGSNVDSSGMNFTISEVSFKSTQDNEFLNHLSSIKRLSLIHI